MDQTLGRIYGMSQADVAAAKTHLMLGGGAHPISANLFS